MAAVTFPRTYFAQRKDGSFYETEANPAKSYKLIVSSILDGNMDDVTFVWMAWNGEWKPFSASIAKDVLDLWKKEDEPERYVPEFLRLHMKGEVQEILESRKEAIEGSWSPAERAYERKIARDEYLADLGRDYAEAAE